MAAGGFWTCLPFFCGGTLMALFSFKYLFRDVTRITPEFLRGAGIRGLVLDVDNTLTAHGSQDVSAEVLDWLAQMRAAGVQMMLASNNYEARVAPFADRLGLSYKSFSCKPLPRSLADAAGRWGLEKGQIAMVGDQLFTDVLAANLYGAQTLMVRPVSNDPSFTVRFKRRLEAPFISRYYRKGGKLL